MIVWINSHESAARVRIYSNNHEWFIINIWKIVNSYLVFVFSTTREWWLMAQRCIYLLSVVFILNTTLRARINIKYNCENPPSVVLNVMSKHPMLKLKSDKNFHDMKSRPPHERMFKTILLLFYCGKILIFYFYLISQNIFT